MEISMSGNNAIWEFHLISICWRRMIHKSTVQAIECMMVKWEIKNGKMELLPNISPRQSTTSLYDLPFLNTSFLLVVRAQIVWFGSQFSLAALFFISLNDVFWVILLSSLSLRFIPRKLIIFFMLLERSWVIRKKNF